MSTRNEIVLLRVQQDNIVPGTLRVNVCFSACVVAWRAPNLGMRSVGVTRLSGRLIREHGVCQRGLGWSRCCHFSPPIIFESHEKCKKYKDDFPNRFFGP